VLYDPARGEPWRAGGDCVDCKRCVQVCPTGIDIRNGLQLECVACAACMDACDEVMTRLRKPRGLIRYASEAGDRKALPFRLRPMAYLTAIGILVVVFALGLIHRDPVLASVVSYPGVPYEIVGTEERKVINRFEVSLVSQSARPTRIELRTEDRNRVRAIAPALPLELAPGESKRVTVFFEFPASALKDGKLKEGLSWAFSSIPTDATEGLNQLSETNLIQKEQEVLLVGPLR
jgi:ferredoxin